jgi:hypothetical protein
MARYIPHKVTFYAYAENEEQVKQLQDALNDFVRQQYNRGAIVTTSKLLQALQKFGNNLFVTNFLKQ